MKKRAKKTKRATVSPRTKAVQFRKLREKFATVFRDLSKGCASGEYDEEIATIATSRPEMLLQLDAVFKGLSKGRK